MVVVQPTHMLQLWSHPGGVGGTAAAAVAARYWVDQGYWVDVKLAGDF